jgi:hypothetical protein
MVIQTEATILSPLVITDQTKELNNKFYIILNEIVNNYPITKAQDSGITPSPEQTAYNENMAKLEVLQNEYFMYKNEVNRANENLQAMISKTNDAITALEAQNIILGVEYANLKSSSHSAKGLFDDAKISRNELLVSNIILLSIMVGCGYGYYKSLKKA